MMPQPHSLSSDTVNSRKSVTWTTLKPFQKDLLKSLLKGLNEEGHAIISKNLLRRDLSITKISTNTFRCLVEAIPEGVDPDSIMYVDKLDELQLFNTEVFHRLSDRV